MILRHPPHVPANVDTTSQQAVYNEWYEDILVEHFPPALRPEKPEMITEETEIEMPEVRVEGESAGPRVFASLTDGDDLEGETSGGGTAARTS